MTRKEKITKILDKYWIRRGWIESDESMVEARPLTAKKELADAIMALPIDVPSEDKLYEWAGYCAGNTTEDHDKRIIYQAALILGAKWAINEILKRNKIE